MTKKNLLLAAVFALSAYLVAGCDGPQVSFADQKKKTDALEEQAKKAPGYDPTRD